jgi:predicted MPP superfamily phosphohydrolase
MFVHWVTFIASLLAAGGISIFLLNNWLIGIEQSPWKIPLIILLPLILVVGFGWLGWSQKGWIWILTLIGIFAWLLISWIKEVQNRKRLQAGPPITITRLNDHRASSSLRKFLLRTHLAVTTTDLNMAFYRVVIPEWEGPVVRVAQASDFHVNASLPVDFFRRVVQAVNAQAPDLILLPGDFVSHDGHEDLLPDLLGGFKARWGTFGTLGNHDYWLGESLTSQLVSQAGIQLIGDEVCKIQVNEGSQTGNVLLFGCQYPWNGNSSPLQPDWPAVQSGDLNIVLSHTPDNFYTLCQQNFDAVLSGHLHAGQFQLPILGAITAPSKYGTRFAYGHYLSGKTHLFVTAGIGSMVPSLRVNCPPDIFFIDFVGSKPA